MEENDVKATAEDVAAEAVDAAEDAEDKPVKKGKGKKIAIIVAVVLVVLIGAGGGGYLAFHDQPWFCNFVCHTPMDPYVASYTDGTSVNEQQVDLEAPILAVQHRDSDQAVDCLDCHEPDMSEQIAEGTKWISGNYTVPLTDLKVRAQLKEGTEGIKAAEEMCLREGCHEGISSVDDLKAYTADLERNPHNSHLGNQDCTTCHNSHEQSVMYCTNCHSDAEVPEGWLTYSEWQKQHKA